MKIGRMQTTQRHVVISDQEYELPYSKGLMASRIMATGLAPGRAFHAAEVIEERLHALDKLSVTSAELTELTLAVLSDVLGRIVSLFDTLLSEKFTNATSVRLMEHAATLDLDGNLVCGIRPGEAW